MSSSADPCPETPAGEPDSSRPSKSRPPFGNLVKVAVPAILIVALAWFGIRSVLAKQQSRPAQAAAIATVKATSGNLTLLLRVSGSTAAQDYVSVRAPIQRGWDRLGLTILNMVPSGRFVHKGEVVAQLDNQRLKDFIEDHTAELEQANLDVENLKAQQVADLGQLQQSAREAKAALDAAELDFKAEEIRTDIDREELKLAVDEARAVYAELEKDMANQKIVQQTQLRMQEITARQVEENLNHLKNDLDRFTIRAPIDGLAVAETLWRRGEQQTVQEGDDVGSGQPILKIVNPASMNVEGELNQTESTELRIGQKAVVQLDAYPGLKFSGTVYSIGAMAEGGFMENNYVRNVPVKIRINGSDPALIPDLSASADVQLSNSGPATLVPRSAVVEQNGRYAVYVKSGPAFEKRLVQVGMQGTLQDAITSGLAPGDVVRLRN